MYLYCGLVDGVQVVRPQRGGFCEELLQLEARRRREVRLQHGSTLLPQPAQRCVGLWERPECLARQQHAQYSANCADYKIKLAMFEGNEYP